MFPELADLVFDFAVAFKEVDASAPRGQSKTRVYQPGLGPLSEAEAVARALQHLVSTKPHVYATASTTTSYPATRQKCDLVIPGQWAIEWKLIRPFGDNGVEAEHWSENALHPYGGNISALGDCLKLQNSGFAFRRAVIVYGFEHIPPRIDLEVTIKAFEVIANKVLNLRLSPRIDSVFGPLIHPYHQLGRIWGWELL